MRFHCINVRYRYPTNSRIHRKFLEIIDYGQTDIYKMVCDNLPGDVVVLHVNYQGMQEELFSHE